MAEGRRRRGTATSSFGVSRREGHDASAFYARFQPPQLSDDAEVHPPGEVDRVFCGDARHMAEVPDGCVALVVTSPPYFAGKAYEEALGEGHIPGTYVEYLQMLRDVFAECVRTLEPGGRIAVNVANLGRKPYRSLAGDVTAILQDDLRLLLRGEVVWVKQRGASGNCAWGSFRQPGNPSLRDVTERVIIASKGRFDRALAPAERCRRGLPHESSLSTEEFMEATLDVWEIPPESARRVGHPAPFPVALPERLIHLYTYLGDLVLDPFMGSGSTAVAAVRTGRHFVGYDTDPAYAAAAQARAEATAPAPVEAHDSTAREARAVLEAAGWRVVSEGARVVTGLEVTWKVADPQGRPWFVDVVGGFTVSRPGLQRAELVDRVIARACVVRAVEPEAPYVVLTAAAPERSAALAAVTGPGRPIHAVVTLADAPAWLGQA